MEKIILNAQSLSVGYDRHVVVPDVTFSVKPGQILVLIGPNGAGKSTVLKTLTRQLSAISGTVTLEEKDLFQLRSEDIARKMSLMSTTPLRGSLMTAEDVVSTGRYPYTGRLGILNQEDHRIVAEAMAMVEIGDLGDQAFDALSDGQKQRVMLARAICQQPEVLILDEPTSYLDIHHKLALLSILKKLVREQKIAVIMSLHELDLAQKCADHVLCIAEGKVDRFGSPEEIFGTDNTAEDGRHYIEKLYGVDKGSFISTYGSLEMERPKGDPKVFVIGGGGSGIPFYRQLQKSGIPFAAGVVHENDMEYPVAKALAANLITEKAFEAISEDTLERAIHVMKSCDRVICALESFGSMNVGNRKLLQWALENDKLRQ